jgi:hypothetical protein
MATRLTCSFPEGDLFWQLPFAGQLKHVSDAVVRLKPLLDFFVKDARN